MAVTHAHAPVIGFTLPPWATYAIVGFAVFVVVLALIVAVVSRLGGRLGITSLRRITSGGAGIYVLSFDDSKIAIAFKVVPSNHPGLFISHTGGAVNGVVGSLDDALFAASDIYIPAGSRILIAKSTALQSNVRLGFAVPPRSLVDGTVLDRAAEHAIAKERGYDAVLASQDGGHINIADVRDTLLALASSAQNQVFTRGVVGQLYIHYVVNPSNSLVSTVMRIVTNMVRNMTTQLIPAIDLLLAVGRQQRGPSGWERALQWLIIIILIIAIAVVIMRMAPHP